MLDFVAQRYGVLPSVLLKEGTSIDVLVSGVAQQWANEKQKEAQALSQGKQYVKPARRPDTKEMEAMLARVRARNG